MHWPDFVFAFHDDDEIGPKMLARIAMRTGLIPERSLTGQSIVNTASVAAQDGQIGQASYSADLRRQRGRSRRAPVAVRRPLTAA